MLVAQAIEHVALIKPSPASAYRDWALLRSDELDAAFQLVTLVLGLAPVILGQQMVEPVQILLRVEVVHQLAHSDQSHQLDTDTDTQPHIDSLPVQQRAGTI